MRQSNLNSISFNYRAIIQARWLEMKERKTGTSIVELALQYGERLAEKIDSKYAVVRP